MQLTRDRLFVNVPLHITSFKGDSMWKLIKWLILIGIIVGVILWFTDFRVGGKSLKERVEEFKQTPLYQDGIKDVRSIVGEALKALGEEISGEVTDDEREQLNNLIKENIGPEQKELRKVPETQSEDNKTWKQEPLKALPRKPEEKPPAR